MPPKSIRPAASAVGCQARYAASWAAWSCRTSSSERPSASPVHRGVRGEARADRHGREGIDHAGGVRIVVRQVHRPRYHLLALHCLVLVRKKALGYPCFHAARALGCRFPEIEIGVRRDGAAVRAIEQGARPGGSGLSAPRGGGGGSGGARRRGYVGQSGLKDVDLAGSIEGHGHHLLGMPTLMQGPPVPVSIR